MLTSAQCRMARACLHWTNAQLAEKSQVSKTTIIRFEGGQSAPNPSTRAALQRAFEAVGVRIDPSGGVAPPDEQQEGTAA